MTDILQNILSTIDIEPKQTAQYSVIWLHGLGADGNDFVPIVPELRLPNTLNIRFVFPHAPVIPVTINNGYQMRAWYDIAGIDRDTSVDKTGITASVTLVGKLIEREVSRGVATHNIVLAGFSQGAVIALTAGLSFSKPLAGVMALSGYFPQAQHVMNAATANRDISIFMAHGTEDNVVPYPLGKMGYDELHAAGFNASWHSYPMAHSVCGPEINDISHWLQQLLKS
jgi:phospholipase/carboxylesterase